MQQGDVLGGAWTLAMGAADAAICELCRQFLRYTTLAILEPQTRTGSSRPPTHTRIHGDHTHRSVATAQLNPSAQPPATASVARTITQAPAHSSFHTGTLPRATLQEPGHTFSLPSNDRLKQCCVQNEPHELRFRREPFQRSQPLWPTGRRHGKRQG